MGARAKAVEGIAPIQGTSPRPVPKLTEADMKAVAEEQKLRAQYKIEVMFSKHRSARMDKPSPLMLLIWESGKKLHGGGDQKMYWCGYDDCGMPISADNFAYMHVVCPTCNRECFLDGASKARHVSAVEQAGGRRDDMLKLPIVVGEKLANLTPPKLAELLEKTWHQLGGDADIYLKYSPYEIRYDPADESGRRIDDQLDRVRVQRQPLIYTLKNIIKDLHAGAELRKRFLAMITS